MSNDSQKIVLAVPHSHIDVEWYWVVGTTHEWTEDILRRAMDLLQRDPRYCFTQDQVYLIKTFFEKLNPTEQALFRKFVAEGRLELVGGMYVQPEVAEPHGECLVRQVLVGQAWLKQTFGLQSKIGWFIDTFGQTPQIPQVLARSGFTHVVFWRDISPEMDFASMPADFYWQSPDGTRLRAHWMPGGYSDHEKQCKMALEHHRTQHILMPHGGDVVRPTEVSSEVEQVLRERMQSLGYTPAEIRVATTKVYFDAVDAEGTEFPVLDCDFNPPFYGQDLRGTYDNRMPQKLLNRAAERSLMNAEMLSSLATLKGSVYPKPALDDLWEKLLFTQFHDTMGCSSSDPVFVTAMERLGAVQSRAENLSAGALETLVASGGLNGRQAVVFNPLSFRRSALVRLPLPAEGVEGLGVVDVDGQPLPAVRVELEQGGAALEFMARDLPAVGYRAYRLGAAEVAPVAAVKGLAGTLENQHLRVQWDAATGDLTSIWDKAHQREVLAGLGNAIVAMREKNGDMEGNIFLTGEKISSGQYKGASIQVSSDSLADRLEVTSDFLDCKLVRRVALYHDSTRIDFETDLLDFHGGDVMINAAFPLALDWPKVRPVYETAYAAISRPFGHYAAQTWVDCSDGSWGAALFNHGTPGYWVGDGSLELTLLRSFANYTGYRMRGLEKGVPGYENSTQTELAREHGTHHFRYSFYPHPQVDTFDELFQIGHGLNTPPVAMVSASGGTVEESFFMFQPGFIATALKQAEDGRGLVIRGFETAGLAHAVTLTVPAAVRSVTRCDLMEQPVESLKLVSGKVVFDCQPYEIASLRMEF
jgi:alpha-mannosidase